MIRFDKVSFGFPQKDLYENISFTLEDGEHAVLIGPNGSGKSTLVNLMMHEEKYTYEGTISKDSSMRVGYVRQFVEHEKNTKTVFEFLSEPFEQLQKKSDDLCRKMEEGTDLESVYDEYQTVMDEIDAVDGYNYESNIKKELATAGILELKDNALEAISGGEYKLLYIIRNMLLKPQLLVLDEPDVFLDFENLIGLSKLINEYEGTVLTITHSRLLLNQCFDKVLDIENQNVREFAGTFAEYNDWLLETKVELFENAHDMDEFIELQKDLIDKIRDRAEMQPDPMVGRRLRARVTYLERLVKMRGEDPFVEDIRYEFTLPEVENEEDQQVLISVKDYCLSYDRPILSDVTFDVMRGDKIAIVGPNGSGKSSLLKELYMRLKEMYSGQVGFFRQIIEEDNVAASGGEKDIAQIKELCESDYSILLMDEPSSHLDIYAQRALEEAIRNYKGTVVIVSHDFYTVTNCTQRVIKLEDHTAREMSGRAYRKSIYKNYFSSDIFEEERLRIDKELKVKKLIKEGNFEEAKELLK